MSYYLIGEKELKERPKLVEKLAELTAEQLAWSNTRGKARAEDKERAYGIVRDIISMSERSYLLSVNEKEIAQGYICVNFPKNKSKYVETGHTFVSRKFRRQKVAERLAYRLIAIARRMGYPGIIREQQTYLMFKLGKKMASNPRKITGRGGKSKGYAPERITVSATSKAPFYETGSVKIDLNPLKGPKVRKSPRRRPK